MNINELKNQFEHDLRHTIYMQSVAECELCNMLPFYPCNSNCRVKYEPSLQNLKISNTYPHLEKKEVLEIMLDLVFHVHKLRQHIDNPENSNNLPKLYFGMASGCEDMIKKHVDQGDDVNCIIKSNQDKLIPLFHVAVSNNQPKVVQTLLHFGADPTIPDNDGLHAIHKVSRLGNIHIINLLLAHGVKVDQTTTSGYTALQFAIYHKQQDVVKLLLEKGADRYYRSPNGISVLNLLMYRYDKEIAKNFDRKILDLEDKTISGYTPLMSIVMNKNVNEAGLYSCCGCSKNECTEANQMNCRIIKSDMYIGALDLLERGANPNAITKDGERPIHYAVHKGCPHLVRKLLYHGAEVNRQEIPKSWSPLHIAAAKNCVTTTKQLLAYGADLDEFLSHLEIKPQMKNIIDQHVIAAQALGRKVNEVFVSRVEQNDEMKMFEIECHKQIDELKKIEMNKNNFTAYDLLRANRRGLAAAATRHNSRFMYDMVPIAMVSAPIYKNTIEVKCEIARRYAPILKKATKSLDVLCCHRLDSLTLDLIIDFLDYNDMKKMIMSTQMLRTKKRQS